MITFCSHLCHLLSVHLIDMYLSLLKPSFGLSHPSFSFLLDYLYKCQFYHIFTCLNLIIVPYTFRIKFIYLG